MNKKITIIELVNKIANGEEVPTKVKYQSRIYKFYKGEKDYISYDDEKTKWCGQTLLFNVMECHHITELLEAEVEILEDTEEIEELKEIETYINVEDTKTYIRRNRDKINELVRSVNQMRKEKE